MLTAMIATLLSIHSAPCFGAGGTDWDYDEPGMNLSHWNDVAPECGLQQQSPIDVIYDEDSSVCDTPLLLEWTTEIQHFAIRNTGRSMKAIPFVIDSQGKGDLSNLEVLHHTNDTNIRLTNKFYNTFTSPTNEEYCFDSLHFHWGRHNEEGSEHTMNGVAYPLELHFVHYSCDYYLAGPALTDYASGAAAEKYDDDHVLAVIGVLFEIGDEPNAELDKILEDTILDGIYQYHDPEELYGEHLLELYYTEFDLEGLLPDNREFIGYKGSLTTPPCYETVRWHVMKERMTVTQAQMDAFRSMLESTASNDSMAPNYRPVQPLYDRTIYQCQETVDAEAVEKDEVQQPDDNTGDIEQELQDTKAALTTWEIVAVVFIILFVIALAYIIYLHNKQRLSADGGSASPPTGYKKAKTMSTANVHEEDVELQDNNNGSNYH